MAWIIFITNVSSHLLTEFEFAYTSKELFFQEKKKQKKCIQYDSARAEKNKEGMKILNE